MAIALVARLAALVRRNAPLRMPRAFWFWLPLAAIEVVAWRCSPRPGAGMGEMRHLLLIAGLFVVLPVLNGMPQRRRVWQGLFITSTAGSAALILGFALRAYRYRHALSLGGDPGFYLRNGGFGHHWMIYATVEILVFGAILEFRANYPENRRWTTLALAINGLAIVLSLTRSLWLTSLLVLGLHLLWRRSKWTWALPVLPAVAFWVVPGPVRYRMLESFQADYYSNTERVQMLQVGWKIIRQRPLLGVGPGRIEELYTSYLSPGDPVPAFHGHLHNNAVQLAAECGVPALGAAVICLAVLLIDLTSAHREAPDRDWRFISRAGQLGLIGFVCLGTADYTYGHSLGLILLSFAAVFPPIPRRPVLVHTCEPGREMAVGRLR
ncbi:MAG TPA: O-antigen ligase family protein [Bryobacteraceae bacterium]|nr:O-antigen ligase family protein [Bryobacteraceae bacterium]